MRRVGAEVAAAGCGVIVSSNATAEVDGVSAPAPGEEFDGAASGVRPLFVWLVGV